MNGIQTNLMNFHEKTEDWVKLYKDYFDGHLGISWDYKIRHFKVNNLTAEEDYNKFESLFWNNVKLAQNNGIELYMVITVTKLFFEYFKNPFDFFEFISSKGIKKLNFERITKTGFARETWEKLGLSNKEYSQNMSRFFKAYKLFQKNNMDLIYINYNDASDDSIYIFAIGTKNKDKWENINYDSENQINNIKNFMLGTKAIQNSTFFRLLRFLKLTS